MKEKFVLQGLIVVSLAVFFSLLFWPGKIKQEFFLDSVSQDNSRDLSGVGAPQEVPILMYHYVRDPDILPIEDSVGRSLSISSARLISNLNTIQAKGLKTATLRELAEGKINHPSVILTFDDGYEDFYRSGWPILKKYQAKATIFIISSKVGRPGYLSAGQIQELRHGGIEIGSHTVSHPNLTNTSAGNLEIQLNRSKTDLESIIGGKVVSFAYPSGQFNEKVIDQLKESGYISAVTTIEDVAQTENSNQSIYTLPRIRIKEKTDLRQILTDLGF